MSLILDMEVVSGDDPNAPRPRRFKRLTTLGRHGHQKLSARAQFPVRSTRLSPQSHPRLRFARVCDLPLSHLIGRPFAALSPLDEARVAFGVRRLPALALARQPYARRLPALALARQQLGSDEKWQTRTTFRLHVFPGQQVSQRCPQASRAGRRTAFSTMSVAVGGLHPAGSASHGGFHPAGWRCDENGEIKNGEPQCKGEFNEEDCTTGPSKQRMSGG
jgi:hypothetical protein